MPMSSAGFLFILLLLVNDRRSFAESKQPPPQPSSDEISSHKIHQKSPAAGGSRWKRTKHTLTDFEVAGVNLATYGMLEEDGIVVVEEGEGASSQPYELYEDFSLAHALGGTEVWGNVLHLRANKLRSSLAFYVDKVAAKKWLRSREIEIPRPFALRYHFELSNKGKMEDAREAILKLLPPDVDYVAKPSNNHRSEGVYIVSRDAVEKTTRVCRGECPTKLQKEKDFDPKEIAESLAVHLYDVKSPYFENFDTNYIEPGIVIEERFTAFDNDDEPALEFKVRTIWGRVHVANWRRGAWKGEWYPGPVHRNGTMVDGSEVTSLPDWVDWSRVVEIAERLGAHKDFFRVDILVGVPAGSPALRAGASERERRAAVKYVVSELELSCWEPFPAEVQDESTRLLLAGYKIGNYRHVPNTEVQKEFQDTDPNCVPDESRK